MRAWLQEQDSYMLHRQVRMRFPSIPYSVNNVMNVWQCDLVDVRALGIFSDKYNYTLTVIDVFSKFLHMVPLKSKTGAAVVSALESVSRDPRYWKPRRRRPVWVITDKGKEFLNGEFLGVLKREGVQFQVCKNPNVKFRSWNGRTERLRIVSTSTLPTRTLKIYGSAAEICRSV